MHVCVGLCFIKPVQQPNYQNVRNPQVCGLPPTVFHFINNWDVPITQLMWETAMVQWGHPDLASDHWCYWASQMPYSSHILQNACGPPWCPPKKAIPGCWAGPYTSTMFFRIQMPLPNMTSLHSLIRVIQDTEVGDGGHWPLLSPLTYLPRWQVLSFLPGHGLLCSSSQPRLAHVLAHLC